MACCGQDSIFWLAVVSILFLAAELTPALLRMPLGTDEITYIARTSIRVNGVSLPPVHGQGAGLLAAPVTLLTESLTAIRVWMSVLSAIGLFLAMLCWRGLRPGWVLGLAGLIFGGLAISQNSGVQVYPDWWGALGVLALTGLLLHAVNGTMRDRVTLPLIALASLVIVLMRPQNIVFIMGPAILAVIFVRDWRKPKVMVAMGVGIALGLPRMGNRGLPLVRRFGWPDPPGRAGAAQLPAVSVSWVPSEGPQRPVVLHSAPWLQRLGFAGRVGVVGRLPGRHRARAMGRLAYLGEDVSRCWPRQQPSG